MNREETARLLRTRSALTSQPYGDEAIDAWWTVLCGYPLDDCQRALAQAARTHQRITTANIIAELPSRTPTPAGGGTPIEHDQWRGPYPSGRHAITRLREHTRGNHLRLPAHDCPACTEATP